MSAALRRAAALLAVAACVCAGRRHDISVHHRSAPAGRSNKAMAVAVAALAARGAAGHEYRTATMEDLHWMLDADLDGFVDRTEFIDVAVKGGGRPGIAVNPSELNWATSAFSVADRNADGLLDANELSFIDLLSRERLESAARSLSHLLAAAYIFGVGFDPYAATLFILAATGDIIDEVSANEVLDHSWPLLAPGGDFEGMLPPASLGWTRSVLEAADLDKDGLLDEDEVMFVRRLARHALLVAAEDAEEEDSRLHHASWKREEVYVDFETFAAIDTNADGGISLEEWQDHLNLPEADDEEAEIARLLFEEADKDKSGGLDPEEARELLLDPR